MTNTENSLNAVIESYREALSSEDGQETVWDIESLLQECGSDWELAGLKAKQEHFQELYADLKARGPEYGDVEEYLNDIETVTHNIFHISKAIELLTGRLNKPALDHPALEQLRWIFVDNSTISEADLIKVRTATIAGSDIRQRNELAITLTAHEDQEIILTVSDIREMLALLEKHKS